jgi:hypothetical protein
MFLEQIGSEAAAVGAEAAAAAAASVDVSVGVWDAGAFVSRGAMLSSNGAT